MQNAAKIGNDFVDFHCSKYEIETSCRRPRSSLLPCSRIPCCCLNPSSGDSGTTVDNGGPDQRWRCSGEGGGVMNGDGIDVTE